MELLSTPVIKKMLTAHNLDEKCYHSMFLQPHAMFATNSKTEKNVIINSCNIHVEGLQIYTE
jgi:hypothetical protein